VIQITPYTFTSQFERDTSPYVFRTSATSRDYAAGVLAMMLYFNWTGIGVINDSSSRGRALADSVKDACYTSGVQVRFVKEHCMQSMFGESAVVILCNPLEGDIWQALEFRVFALAVAPKILPRIVRTIQQGHVHDKVFVVEGLTTSMAVLSTKTRLAMQGWLSLDHPQRGNSEAASRFQKAWYSMDQISLASMGLHDHMFHGMQEASQLFYALYGTSPFRLNTAHVLDAIAAALIAAKKSMPLMQNGVFQQKSLFEALNKCSFDGASGHISFTSNMTGTGSINANGGLASAALTLRQVQKGRLARLGTVDRPGGNDAARTWRVRLTRGFPLLPVDQPQSRSHHAVQYQREQNVLAQMGWSSTIMKTLIGCVAVVLVCIAFPSRYHVRGWARTAIDKHQSGGQSHRLSTAHHDDDDDEAADEVTKLLDG